MLLHILQDLAINPDHIIASFADARGQRVGFHIETPTLRFFVFTENLWDEEEPKEQWKQRNDKLAQEAFERFLALQAQGNGPHPLFGKGWDYTLL